MADKKSLRANSSHNSRSSTRASAAVSAEAAKARIAFVEKEVKIKMELEKLPSEKETVTETLKTADDEWNVRISHSNYWFDPVPTDPSPHVRRYLAEQTSQHAGLITGTQPLRNQEINHERQTRQMIYNDKFPPYRGLETRLSPSLQSSAITHSLHMSK